MKLHSFTRCALLAACIGTRAGIYLGAQNSQAVIDHRSVAYTYLDAISMEQGLVVPNNARPWTAGEFRFELSRISPEGLSRAGATAYRYLVDLVDYEVPETMVQGSAGIAVSTEAYGHVHLGGDAGYTPESYVWTYGYEDRKSFLEIPLAMWLGDHFYALMKTEIKEDPDTVNTTLNSAGVFPSGVTDNYFNVIFDDPYPRLDLYFPFEVYSVLGGPGWAARFGRDQVSWGNGTSGNMLLSDYSDFYDFAGLTLFGKNLKFSSIYSVFDSFDPKTLAGTPYSAFTAHRLDFRLFDRLLISINESVVFGNAEPELVRDLNYLMIFHNWTIPERTNSLLSVELNYTPWRYFQVYGQAAMDEFMTKFEADRDGNGGPPIFSYLAGLRGAYPAGPGYINAGLEWAMTSPWMYNRKSSPYYYNVRRYYSLTTEGTEYIIKPIGYQYGPDALVLNAFASYGIPDGPQVSGTIMYLQQGETTIATAWNPQAGDSTPSGVTPMSTWSVGIDASFPFFAWLEAGFGASFITKYNIDNVIDTYSNDLEFSAYAALRF